MKKTSILNRLRSSGLRPTKQRLEIAKYLFNRDKTFHFTVESLDKLLAKKTTTKFALATIYNTVHAFKKAGHLSEVRLKGKNNTAYFDTNISNHHHFYDSETSELIDINEKEIKFEKIPKAPNGKNIKNIEVVINLKD